VQEIAAISHAFTCGTEQVAHDDTQIQEHKSAIISNKQGQWSYDYGFRDEIVRIATVEQVAGERVQFSMGNDCARAIILGVSDMGKGKLEVKICMMS
jgi:hypothetical protein